MSGQVIAFPRRLPPPVYKAELEEVRREILKLIERRNLLSAASVELKRALILHRIEERSLQKKRLAIAERFAQGAPLIEGGPG